MIILIAGTNCSQGMGVVAITEKSKNNASRSKKSDRTCALSRESLK